MPPLDNPNYYYNDMSASDDSDDDIYSEDTIPADSSGISLKGLEYRAGEMSISEALYNGKILEYNQSEKLMESEKYDALANVIFPAHNSGPRSIYQTKPIDIRVPITFGKMSWTFTDPSEETTSRLKTITLDTNGIHMDNISQYTRGATRSLKQCIYCYYWHVSNMTYNMEGDNICYHCAIFFGLPHEDFTVDDYINLCVCDHDETTCKKGEMCKLCENIQKKYDYQKEMKEKLLEKSYDFVIEI